MELNADEAQMKVFAERGELRNVLVERLEGVRAEVNGENEDRLLGMNEDEYLRYLVDRWAVESLAIDFDRIESTDREAMIPAEHFPPLFHVLHGKRYPKQVITFHFPVSGNEELLYYTPSHHLMWTQEAESSRSDLSLDVVNFTDDPNDVARHLEEFRKNLRTQCGHVNNEVNSFNATLKERAAEFVAERKREILKRRGMMEKLGVPVRRAADVPKTFTVPIQRRTIAVKKPEVPAGTFKPEWYLEDCVYQDILAVIHDLGVNMERLPSVYEGKDEEALRDLLLMQLAPHFQSVTGETFNRKGKTDILIRHEGGNVFVAECKIWRGPQYHLDAITQALGNLTWRDSKAALVCFIQKVKLQPILDSVAETTKKHSAFAAERPATKQGWLNYDFHLLGDPSRRVRLAILCFHLPKPANAQQDAGG